MHVFKQNHLLYLELFAQMLIINELRGTFHRITNMEFHQERDSMTRRFDNSRNTSVSIFTQSMSSPVYFNPPQLIINTKITFPQI